MDVTKRSKEDDVLSLDRAHAAVDVDQSPRTTPRTPSKTDGPLDVERYSGAALDHARGRLEKLVLLSRNRVPAVVRYGADTMAAFDLGVRPAVRRALERLDEGSYGSCDHCCARISAARLAAIPYARRCEPCQRAAEDHWDELDAMIAERVRALAGEPQGPAWSPGRVAIAQMMRAPRRSVQP
jgi:hypothetical protein